MDLLSGLTADVMPEPLASMEVCEWKIQLVAQVYFSRRNYCLSRAEAFCRVPFGLPTIIW